MINRFRGQEGRDRLISALRKQIIIHDNETLSIELAGQAELLQFEPIKISFNACTNTLPKERLIVQDSVDDEIYFILAGRLAIVVNGREVAIRQSV